MSERKHPFCNVCGWRKGGVHSWNGRACKCGHYEPPFPLDPPADPPVPTKENDDVR